jgi:hypothetical protein
MVDRIETPYYKNDIHSKTIRTQLQMAPLSHMWVVNAGDGSGGREEHGRGAGEVSSDHNVV